MKRTFFFLVNTLLFLGFTACTRKSPPRLSGACASEVQQFCASVEPGNGRIVRCLDEHLSNLSASCRALQDKRRNRVSTVAATASAAATTATESQSTDKTAPAPPGTTAAKNTETTSGICTGKEPCVDGAKSPVKTAKTDKKAPKTSSSAQKK